MQNAANSRHQDRADRGNMELVNCNKFQKEIKPPVQAKNESQKEFLRAFSQYDVSAYIAPAGCGKTYLSMCQMADALKKA